MVVSLPYRVKNLPRAAGALEPWIALWQLMQAREMRRVFTFAFGCPVLLLQAVDVSPGRQTQPPAAP
jgi:hypothetical protein